MLRSFIVPGGRYKAKTTSVVFFFFFLKKTYLPAGSVIICTIGGAVLFASTKIPQVCVFPGKIMTLSSQISLMSFKERSLHVPPAKWRSLYPMFYST